MNRSRAVTALSPDRNDRSVKAGALVTALTRALRPASAQWPMNSLPTFSPIIGRYHWLITSAAPVGAASCRVASVCLWPVPMSNQPAHGGRGPPICLRFPDCGDCGAHGAQQRRAPAAARGLGASHGPAAARQSNDRRIARVWPAARTGPSR